MGGRGIGRKGRGSGLGAGGEGGEGGWGGRGWVREVGKGIGEEG